MLHIHSRTDSIEVNGTMIMVYSEGVVIEFEISEADAAMVKVQLAPSIFDLAD